MDTDFILKQVVHMRPSSLCVREQQRYRAEKMLLRQFILMKLQYHVPIDLRVEDMKKWLLRGRSFLGEFPEISKQAEARKLLMAELAWTSARRLCVNQMEQEILDELEKEKCLSLLLRRKVTLEGLQMFLSVIRPKAEQDVQTFLRHLSNKLLNTFTGCHTSKRSKLALLSSLQRTTAPLVPQLVQTALDFFLDEAGSLVEVGASQTQDALVSRDLSLEFALRNRAEAASAHIGTQVAEAAAFCFCLNTPFTRACLLPMCTSVAHDMVKAICKRFIGHSKTFHLMDFDESFITAREGVICAIQDMDDRVRGTEGNQALHQIEETSVAPEVCCVAAAERSDEKDKERKKGVLPFFSRMWKKMTWASTKE